MTSSYFTVAEYEGNVYVREELVSSTTVYCDRELARFDSETEANDFCRRLEDDGFMDDHGTVL